MIIIRMLFYDYALNKLILYNVDINLYYNNNNITVDDNKINYVCKYATTPKFSFLL